MFARSQPTIDLAEEAKNEAIKQFQSMFCGSEGQPQSTEFVIEIALPSECEMPLAVEVDEGRVWYVSTKQGTLGSYDTATAQFEEHTIPSWPARSDPIGYSMSWAAKADDNGNVWFTDDRQKALWKFEKSSKHFEIFSVPANLPASLDFDASGNVYFIGVQSQSIFFGDISKMRNGTSDGIAEISLPVEAFGNLRITTGSLVVDNVNKNVWVSLLAFQQKGQLFRYDIDSGKVDKIVDLPDDLRSPVGLTLDGSSNVWVTDHGTNIFFKYDLAMDRITKFVTSVASPVIYGGSTPPNAYTLPYWIEKSPDENALWFNEHTGNKIARFDPESLVLTEYWIPSQNRHWALCPENAATCGMANALQFSAGPNGEIWFSEWTENKLGKVEGSRPLPFSVAAQDEVSVRRGDSVEIRIDIDSSLGFNGTMMAAGTFTPTGLLGDSVGIFSQDSISLDKGESKQVSYIFTPAESVETGDYTIMIGAANEEVSILKAVNVHIV